MFIWKKSSHFSLPNILDRYRKYQQQIKKTDVRKVNDRKRYHLIRSINLLLLFRFWLFDVYRNATALKRLWIEPIHIYDVQLLVIIINRYVDPVFIFVFFVVCFFLFFFWFLARFDLVRCAAPNLIAGLFQLKRKYSCVVFFCNMTQNRVALFTFLMSARSLSRISPINLFKDTQHPYSVHLSYDCEHFITDQIRRKLDTYCEDSIS